MTLEAQLPAFTKLIACPNCYGKRIEICPSCNGKKWKRERGGYSMIVCPKCNGHGIAWCSWCSGEGRIPEGNVEGKYAKKVIIGGFKG